MSIAEMVQEATLKVIAEEGVKAVTIRRVALELDRSTTVITHYFDSRESLLRESVSAALRERRESAETLIAESAEPLWDFLEWSIQDEHIEIWHALLAASHAGSETEVTRLVEEFEEWWSVTLESLLKGKVRKGHTVAEVSDVIGIVVEGLLFINGKQTSSRLNQSQLLRIAIGSLLN
jgi:AcrR family transcriptional regulator